jgi:hypothetical protein
MRRLAAALALSAGLAGCLPQMHQRQFPVLEGRALDDYTVRHDQAGDCLLRHTLPVSYEVKRPRYTLRLTPSGSEAGEPLVLNAILGGHDLSLHVQGARLSGPASGDAGTQRYRLEASAGGELRLEIRRGEEVLGLEFFRLSAERCRALLLDGR